MGDHWYLYTDEKYLAYLNSKEWKTLRKQVIERCNNTCERCGKLCVSQIHHLTYARVYHEKLDDVQGLCEYCHDFLHGKRTDDGTAKYARRVERQLQLLQAVENGRSELRRFEERQGAYRRFSKADFAFDKELMAILRQHPRVIFSSYEGRIASVCYAKRVNEPGVTFSLQWGSGNDRCCRPIHAEEWLFSGKVVFDTERGVWVDIHCIKSFVERYDRDQGR